MALPAHEQAIEVTGRDYALLRDRGGGAYPSSSALAPPTAPSIRRLQGAGPSGHSCNEFDTRWDRAIATAQHRLRHRLCQLKGHKRKMRKNNHLPRSLTGLGTIKGTWVPNGYQSGIDKTDSVFVARWAPCLHRTAK